MASHPLTKDRVLGAVDYLSQEAGRKAARQAGVAYVRNGDLAAELMSEDERRGTWDGFVPQSGEAYERTGGD